MSELTRFLIVGMQRSGTTVTHHCLGGHPQVSLTTDEVSTDPFFSKGLSVFTTGRESFAARRRGYQRLFDAISLAATDRPVRAAGLKVALASPEDAVDLVECVREYFEGLKVVMVRRADLVAQCGSLYRAMRTGQWHAFGKKAGGADEKISIPLEEFDVYVRNCRRIEAQLDRLKATHPVCELLYERDIEKGLDKDRLFDFVGVDRLPAAWMEMQKVSPPAEKFIANHAELVARQPTIPLVAPQAAEDEAMARQKVRAAKEQPYLLVYRAEDRLRRGRLPEAELDVGTLLVRAKELDPWLAGRVVGLARALAERGVVCGNGAAEVLSNTHVDDGPFHLHRADVQLRYGLAALALADLRRATLELACVPHDQEWASWLVEQALLAQGDMQAATDFVTELGARYATSAPFLFLGALVAHKAGQPAAARSLLERALKADPGHARARQLRATIG